MVSSFRITASSVLLDNLVAARCEAARGLYQFPRLAIIPCVVNGVIMINWRHGGHGLCRGGMLNVSP